MNEQVKRAIPNIIYLQYFGEEEPEVFNGSPNMNDVCWSTDRVYDTDIEYKRATLLATCSKENIKQAWLKSWNTALDEGHHPSGDKDIKQRAWKQFAVLMNI